MTNMPILSHIISVYEYLEAHLDGVPSVLCTEYHNIMMRYKDTIEEELDSVYEYNTSPLIDLIGKLEDTLISIGNPEIDGRLPMECICDNYKELILEELDKLTESLDGKLSIMTHKEIDRLMNEDSNESYETELSKLMGIEEYEENTEHNRVGG